MAYDWKDYAAEMDAFDRRIRRMGVSTSAYAGLAVIESPYVPEWKFIVDRPNRIVMTRSKNYLVWRIELRQVRIDARADLDRLVAAAWKRSGVDESTASK